MWTEAIETLNPYETITNEATSPAEAATNPNISMGKATKTTLPSATILNLIFGVIFAILLIGLLATISHMWFTEDIVTATFLTFLFCILPIPLSGYLSFDNFRAYSRRTTFDLYELSLMDIINVKTTLEEIQKDYIIIRQESWGLTFVKREDLKAYCDWSLLHYRPKVAAPGTTE